MVREVLPHFSSLVWHLAATVVVIASESTILEHRQVSPARGLSILHPAFAKTYYVSSYLTLLFKTDTLQRIK